MKRKDYEKPAVQVFELKQQPQLLAGSVTSTPDSGLEDFVYDDELIM